MRPYGEQPKNSSAKRHPANECGVCAENYEPEKTRARMKAHDEIRREMNNIQEGESMSIGTEERFVIECLATPDVDPSLDYCRHHEPKEASV